MTETPELPAEPTSVETATASPTPVKPNKLYQVAAWVVIIAGTVFVAAVIFFSGAALTHHHGHHHSMMHPGGQHMGHHRHGAPTSPGPAQPPQSVTPATTP